MGKQGSRSKDLIGYVNIDMYKKRLNIFSYTLYINPIKPLDEIHALKAQTSLGFPPPDAL